MAAPPGADLNIAVVTGYYYHNVFSKVTAGPIQRQVWAILGAMLGCLVLKVSRFSFEDFSALLRGLKSLPNPPDNAVTFLIARARLSVYQAQAATLARPMVLYLNRLEHAIIVQGRISGEELRCWQSYVFDDGFHIDLLLEKERRCLAFNVGGQSGGRH